MTDPATAIRRALLPLLAVLGLGSGAPSYAQADPAAITTPVTPTVATPVDYTTPASWLCRPGNETTCTADLDALVIGPDGIRTPQPFAAAANPPVDCFYVYPTVSREQSDLADMTPSPEIVKVAQAQAGRLASRCRLFVPLYRQMTLPGLERIMGSGKALNWDAPYVDVLAAWRDYLARDNQGRGVILVGHSQGTILLQRLIAEEIDGKPVQARIVSAFLAGDPALPVPPGKTVGGVFKQFPLCSSAAQTGCAYVWGSYAADDTQKMRYFGHVLTDGTVPACVTPAAPSGGSGMLKSYLPKPAMAPADDPAWIEVTGQMSAACVADASGDVQRITVEDTRFKPILTAMLAQFGAYPGWGVHRLDVSLVEGNMLDVIDAETKSWATH